MKNKLIFLSFIIAGCGVKGDPIPPGTPAEIGRGMPSYKKATEDLAFPHVPALEDEKKKKPNQ